ncbi:dTDP-4-dehydrorhamnose 3,5-epimerase [Candidatus Pelagibacter sp.]|nr:dTDP-4-dehydrorhamnose 3,5-epimerase [Candidatus Pelagibacter sp.]
MKFNKTCIKDNFLINLEPREDKRGFFARYYCEKEFLDQGLNTKWLQINNSFSKDVGTLRGLHYQNVPNAEVKLIRCLKGAIWDVVVDLRDNSNTFGKWFGEKLSSENRTMMYVPKGLAHGFISLTPNSEILYLVSDFYAPESEGNLIWNDPDVGIEWPINPLIISDKDKSNVNFKNIVPIKL